MQASDESMYIAPLLLPCVPVLPRRKSFSMYLLHLMTQWAVVADIWFLEPQFQQPNETAIEFAER